MSVSLACPLASSLPSSRLAPKSRPPRPRDTRRQQPHTHTMNVKNIMISVLPRTKSQLADVAADQIYRVLQIPDAFSSTSPDRKSLFFVKQRALALTFSSIPAPFAGTSVRSFDGGSDGVLVRADQVSTPPCRFFSLLSLSSPVLLLSTNQT